MPIPNPKKPAAGLVTLALCIACCYSTSSRTQTPTVVLVSLDGFRADYLEKFETKTLDSLAREGVRARYLEPIFPTKTFPNHYTLVTGRYAENHGIVSNTMWDEALGQFSLGNRAAVTDGRWWDDAEPIWITLHKAGIKSAMYFWPGSEAEINGLRPALYKTFSPDSLWEARIRWVMAALARPENERPHLLTLYLEHVDSVGHAHGPNAEEMGRAIAAVDRYLETFVHELARKELLDNVNIVVTSDHGMAATSRDSVVFLDDYVSLNEVTVTDWDPVLALAPRAGNVDSLFSVLHPMPHVTFYAREDLPTRLHYRAHDRIRPIIGIADVGWRISSRAFYASNPERYDGGTHGYDPADPRMHGIFIAHGPAFREGTVVDGFSSIHVYALLCSIFGVAPAENDGDLEAVKHLLK